MQTQYTHICANCGKQFQSRFQNQKFCNQKCMGQSMQLTVIGFWMRVDQSRGKDACWPWLGCKLKKMNYGQVHWHGHIVYAHRVAFELTNKSIPSDMNVLHKCDNPSCCNPAHLWLGNNADNVADKMAKGRMRHCKLTPDQAEEIRSRYAIGDISQTKLAKEFGIDQSRISKIVHGKAWKHY